MKREMFLTRRKFLFASLLSFAGLQHSTRGLAFPLEQAKHKDISNALISTFSSRDSLKFIGQQYIQQFPRNRSEPALLESILYGRHSAAFQESMLLNKKELTKFIQCKVKDDFSNQRFVSIRGWMLSETEASISALAYLEI